MSEEASQGYQNTENEILAENGTETFRTPQQYAVLLGFDDYATFRRSIHKKTIADIGSGVGAFAKLSAYDKNLQTTVISVNPRLSIPSYKLHEEKATKSLLKGASPETIQQVQRIHDEHLITAFAHDLSLIADNTCDYVFDVNAISYYAKPDDVSFPQSLREMLRILKIGGQLRIADEGIYGQDPPSFQEKILQDMQLPYEVNREFDEGYRYSLGVTITKK